MDYYWQVIDHMEIDLSVTIKQKLFQVVAVSLQLNWCTYWILKKHEKKNLNAIYTRMLRAILDKSYKQHLRKQLLYGLLAPISQTIQEKWAGQAVGRTQIQHEDKRWIWRNPVKSFGVVDSYPCS